MTRLMLVACAVLMVGCARPVFDGTYSGLFNVYSVCSDGSGDRHNVSLGWTLAVTGSTMRVDTGAACTGWTGSVAEDVANLDHRTCSPMVVNGVTVTEELTGGVLTLNDFGDISMILQTHRAFSGALTGFCDDGAVGVLSRN